jgi:hypothetical protein
MITGNEETLMVALVRSEGLLKDVTDLGTSHIKMVKITDNVYILYKSVTKLLPNITKLYHFKSATPKGI